MAKKDLEDDYVPAYANSENPTPSHEEWIHKACEDMARTDFSVDRIVFPGFYRVLEGEHKDRIIIYSIVNNKIDGKKFVLFANNMAWIYVEKLAGIKCEGVTPDFNGPKKPVNLPRWDSLEETIKRLEAMRRDEGETTTFMEFDIE